MSNYILTKTSPNDVIFTLHPLSNPQLSKIIRLTKRMPKQALPEDWALGIFFDTSLYDMYKKGIFTFDRNDDLVKAAVANNVYFDDSLDFTPAKETLERDVLTILKAGNRSNILKAIDKHGKDFVKDVAIANVSELTNAITSMLEEMFKISLTVS